MPQLQWEELDFLECLEVVPETEEYGTFFSYHVERVAHTLLLTIWPYESVVQLSLVATSSKTHLIDMALIVRGTVRHINDKRGEYLELQNCVVAPSRFWYLEVGDLFDQSRFPLGVTVEIEVKPEIQVRLR